MSKSVMRLAAVLVFALGTSACSTIDSAISDVAGDDTPAASPPADANGFPADTPPPAATTDAAAPTSPDLAAIPDKPSGVTTPDAQRAAADSLAADANRSRYSGEALRGGTEAAAPPPGPPGATPVPAPSTAVADNSPPPAAAAPPPPDNTPAPDNTAPPQPDAATPPPAVTDNSVPGPSAAPSTPVASMAAAPPPGAQPAVPAVSGVPGSMPMAVSDANLGFRPSTAPPLDPSISQFVAAPIIARYQQTASNGGAATGPIAPTNGGYASSNGLSPAAVVLFLNDGTALNAAGRAQVRAAVAAFRQHGSSGFIKVVGHSSSRPGNMPAENHMVAIFAKSQARANVVAKEIIREGVPANHVLVEAVGDSQPVYYESMPQGEAGNRRAEIFLQG